jgi:hypothetical protein
MHMMVRVGGVLILELVDIQTLGFKSFNHQQLQFQQEDLYPR